MHLYLEIRFDTPIQKPEEEKKTKKTRENKNTRTILILHAS